MNFSNQPCRVCVIIPVYNEAENIGAVVGEVQSVPADARYSLKVMVVDGGSQDDTVRLATEAGAQVVRQRGKGYGAACFSGYGAAEDFDILVYLDGDYSDPPAAIPTLLDKMLAEQADLVLGSRTLAASQKGALPLHAVIGNRLVTKLISLLYHQSFSDLPSFKAVRREVLTALRMQEMTYGWTVEMLVKAARANYKIAEVGVAYRKRGGGKSKVSGTVQGTLKAGYHLVKTAWRYRQWQPTAYQLS